jgi:hypothetical protein
MVKWADVSAGRGELWRWAWVACCCAMLAATAHAGAWNDRPAHGQLIMTTSLFRAWDQYGANGQRSPFANAGRFQQIQFGEYLELGLSRRWTVALNLPISNLQYSDTFNKQESGALGDVEIGIRRQLNGLSSPWAVSGQFTVTVRGYKAMLDPAPGNHQEDVEGRFLVGRGANWGERHWFWNAEAAYRYRTQEPADQMRGDFTAGVDLLSRVTLLGQVYSIKGLRNGAPLTAKSDPNAQSDFDLYKAQGSPLRLPTPHPRKASAGGILERLLVAGLFLYMALAVAHYPVMAIWPRAWTAQLIAAGVSALWWMHLEMVGMRRLWGMAAASILLLLLAGPWLRETENLRAWLGTLGCGLFVYAMIWVYAAHEREPGLQPLATAALVLSIGVLAKPAVVAGCAF